MSSDHRLLVAALAVALLVAASSASLVVAETRRHLLAPDAQVHAVTGDAAQAVPAYQLCPDGSAPAADGSCPVHHTRPS